jgi:hypothetical protein
VQWKRLSVPEVSWKLCKGLQRRPIPLSNVGELTILEIVMAYGESQCRAKDGTGVLSVYGYLSESSPNCCSRMRTKSLIRWCHDSTQEAVGYANSGMLRLPGLHVSLFRDLVSGFRCIVF